MGFGGSWGWKSEEGRLSGEGRRRVGFDLQDGTCLYPYHF
jgi:hypothetical protein